MVLKKKLLALLMGTALVLAACGGDDEATDPKPADENSGEEVTGADSTEENNVEEEVVTVDVEKVAAQKCMQCHGQDLVGGRGPELATVGSRMTKEEIKAILLDGNKTMPPNLLKSEEEVDAVSEWLANKK